MQSCVIVLLKLLLATVTGQGAPGATMQAPLPIASPTTEQPRKYGSIWGLTLTKSIAEASVPPPSKEEVDMARHREITSKAVSAILVLVLKWFKASRWCLLPPPKVSKSIIDPSRYPQIPLCRPTTL